MLNNQFFQLLPKLIPSLIQKAQGEYPNVMYNFGNPQEQRMQNDIEEMIRSIIQSRNQNQMNNINSNSNMNMTRRY